MDGQDPHPWWWHPTDDDDDHHDHMFFDFSMAQGEVAAAGAGQPLVPGDRSPPQIISTPLSADPVPHLAPTEDMMAAWLYPIVSGSGGAADDTKSPMAEETRPMVTTTESLGTMTTRSKGKLPTTEGMSSKDTKRTSEADETRKTSAGGGPSSSSSRRTRSSHYSGTHNSTEKRRRCKIAERLRTLQRLVPGCDKSSNQASTLEQTIQYMKSLQQQLVHARPPPPAAAAAEVCAYPVVVPMQPAFAVAVAPMLGYHAVMMPAAAPFGPAAASAAPGAAGGQQQQEEGKGSYASAPDP